MLTVAYSDLHLNFNLLLGTVACFFCKVWKVNNCQVNSVIFESSLGSCWGWWGRRGTCLPTGLSVGGRKCKMHASFHTYCWWEYIQGKSQGNDQCKQVYIVTASYITTCLWITLKSDVENDFHPSRLNFFFFLDFQYIFTTPPPTHTCHNRRHVFWPQT